MTTAKTLKQFKIGTDGMPLLYCHNIVLTLVYFPFYSISKTEVPKIDSANYSN